MTSTRIFFLAGSFLFIVHISSAQPAFISYDSLAVYVSRAALQENTAYSILTDLCTHIGARIAGSAQAAAAVKWARMTMNDLGFQNVRLQPVQVPHWIRGTESGTYSVNGKKEVALHLCALGGSVGTSPEGVSGDIVEVDSWEALKVFGDKGKGKIILFNRPMDPGLVNPGEAYGRAVDQRTRGAVEAERAGAIAALVRSMTTRHDDIPHTGQMHYETTPKIPAAAVSTNDADTISALLARGKNVRVTLKLGCAMLPDVQSDNVLGEIRGSEKPEELIVIGAHLDSWDKGQGAHDDGAGCAHVLEALHLIKELGLIPKRTIRVVLFMNEENGVNGGLVYAAEHIPNEKHIAAIETDAGGFSPRGFSVGDSSALLKLQKYSQYFKPIGAERFVYGHGGADISPLGYNGVITIGLQVDGQKYFDYHHSDSDILENVNERELALGSSAVAILAYLIAQEGL
ncbi:MAG: M28 family peptidase [Bacteroidota bacterium]